jgi:hypothetical protein
MSTQKRTGSFAVFNNQCDVSVRTRARTHYAHVRASETNETVVKPLLKNASKLLLSGSYQSNRAISAGMKTATRGISTSALWQ